MQPGARPIAILSGGDPVRQRQQKRPVGEPFPLAVFLFWTALDDVECAQDEGVVEGDLAQVVVAAGGSAVAGGHVGVEQERVLVGA